MGYVIDLVYKIKKKKITHGKATLVTEHTWSDRRVWIKAGIKFETDPELYHNHPDIVISLFNSSEIYVLEIAISHLQNIEVQEGIKRVRCAKNSKLNVTQQNFKDVHRELGKILNTKSQKEFMGYLKKLGSSEDKIHRLVKTCSVSFCKSTSKIILQRLT